MARRGAVFAEKKLTTVTSAHPAPLRGMKKFVINNKAHEKI